MLQGIICLAISLFNSVLRARGSTIQLTMIPNKEEIAVQYFHGFQNDWWVVDTT